MYVLVKHYFALFYLLSPNICQTQLHCLRHGEFSLSFNCFQWDLWVRECFWQWVCVKQDTLTLSINQVQYYLVDFKKKIK